MFNNKNGFMEDKNLNKIILNSAAISGVYLGLYFVLKYILFMYMIPNFILSIPYYIMTILVPVIVYFFAKDFKNKNSDLDISFVTIWRYGVCLYVFASIISMFAHYYYFKFRMINNLYELKQISEDYFSITPMAGEMNRLVDQLVQQSQDVPVYQLVLNDFGFNMIAGAFVSLIVAFVLRKK